jgi:hypothetical protein
MSVRGPEKPRILRLIVGFSHIIFAAAGEIRPISGSGREIVLWLTDTKPPRR